MHIHIHIHIYVHICTYVHIPIPIPIHILLLMIIIYIVDLIVQNLIFPIRDLNSRRPDSGDRICIIICHF